MDSALIGIIIFVGILSGVIIGYLLILFKNNLLKKNALKKIKEQRLKFQVNGKTFDLAGKIEKETEQNQKKGERIMLSKSFKKKDRIIPSKSHKKKHKKVRVRKMKKGKK